MHVRTVLAFLVRPGALGRLNEETFVEQVMYIYMCTVHLTAVVFDSPGPLHKLLEELTVGLEIA